MSASMTREAALRVGLAARALGGAQEGIDPRGFVTALADRLGLPLTEAKLATVTVADLKVILQGDEIVQPDIAMDALKAAARLLWGEGVSGSELPAVEAYAEGDLPGSIRVACASNNDERLDGHFGSCERFLIYQVSPTALRLIDLRPTLAADQEDDRNVARAALIGDCQVVYVQSIGGPAVAKVVRAGVHPVKVGAGTTAHGAAAPGAAAPVAARDTLAQLQQALRRPPPWLARIMGVEAGSLARFATQEDD